MEHIDQKVIFSGFFPQNSQGKKKKKKKGGDFSKIQFLEKKIHSIQIDSLGCVLLYTSLPY